MRVWVASLVFYAFVFAVCEFLRYLIFRLMPKRLSTELLLEVSAADVHSLLFHYLSTKSSKITAFISLFLVCWNPTNMYPDVWREHCSGYVWPVRCVHRDHRYWARQLLLPKRRCCESLPYCEFRLNQQVALVSSMIAVLNSGDFMLPTFEGYTPSRVRLYHSNGRCVCVVFSG